MDNLVMWLLAPAIFISSAVLIILGNRKNICGLKGAGVALGVFGICYIAFVIFLFNRVLT